jgi:hypothetical protein
MTGYLYENFLFNLSEKFSRKISEIEADHNFELGDEFEYAICEMLQDFLPSKFGVTRGFVVSRDGRKAGDDIIIFDQERFPTLRIREKNQFHRLENVPIEAVYAYIEAKHTITFNENKSDSTFRKALNQATVAKTLISERETMSPLTYNPYIKELPFFGARLKNNLLVPSISNPSFSCILARNFIFEGPNGPETLSLDNLVENFRIPNQSVIPDLIVLNKDIILCPRIYDNGEFKENVIFNHNNLEHLSYQVVVKENIAFGFFLCHLAFALDWIRLGKMPWGDILFDAVKKK